VRIAGRSGVPRKPGIFVAGGTYHVYCRGARRRLAEEVFGKQVEAVEAELRHG
jgi:hypothetical protein